MKQGKTLKDLAAEILRQRESRRDFIADTRHTRMTPEGDLVYPVREDVPVLLEEECIHWAAFKD